MTSFSKTSALSRHHEMIEAGLAPMGIHKGKSIKSLPAKTLLYYADKFESADNTVYGQYIYACIDAALELGYIHQRDAERRKIREINLLSNYIGNIGERIEINCEIKNIYFNETLNYYTTIMMCDNDIVKYFGSTLGKVGDNLSLRCTIKRHDLWEDIKSTTISRPKVL